MIRSTLDQAPMHKPDFPKLMIREGDGIVVLMVAVSKAGPAGLGTGMLLMNGPASEFDVGHYSSYWGMNEFEDYRGTLTLENM